MCRVLARFDQGKHQSGPEQLKDDGNCGRGGQGQTVIDVEQEDVRDHHCEEDHHQFVHRKEGRGEDALSRHFHHPA